MTNDAIWFEIVTQLRGRGIAFEQGLTEREVSEIEGAFAFRFPSDLSLFLQTGLPHGNRFPNWRAADRSVLQDWLQLPADGICFDVEHNHVWPDIWGPRPAALQDALAIARGWVAKAPVLIPIYGHRFMPDRPRTAGNPVLSVHQTDIIYYGYDLADYFAHEFGIANTGSRPNTPRNIESWDVFVG